METKPLLFGLIGFFAGGLLVSVAATTFDKPMNDMSAMTQELEDKRGDDYDKAFIARMIEHHEAAVDMAKLSNTNAKHVEIKNLSRDIVRTQQIEIDQMKEWQMAWGYDSASHETMSH